LDSFFESGEIRGINMTFELSEAKNQIADMQKAIDGFRGSL
jgi:hypothetical protein